jgi:hypothetical protein
MWKLNSCRTENSLLLRYKDQLIVSKEIIAVYSQNRMKHTYTLRIQNVGIFLRYSKWHI